jgi:HAD superfamily hydrolase (TIGR01509 family)
MIKGVIFDVDDTLLDNKLGVPGQGLHERSRLAAVHTVGKKHGIKELEALTAQQNLDAFLNAPVHTLESAVWNILLVTGVVGSEVPDLENPLFKEIVALKNELHEVVLREHGEAMPGAIPFVQALAHSGLKDQLAIASSAVRRDVMIFLEMTNLKEFFPDERIKTKESITHPKPNPEVFDLAFSTLGLHESDKKDVYVFEDDPRGIMAAKAAGLFTCAIATARFSKKDLLGLEVPPDLAAESYEEFAELLGIKL